LVFAYDPPSRPAILLEMRRAEKGYEGGGMRIRNKNRIVP